MFFFQNHDYCKSRPKATQENRFLSVQSSKGTIIISAIIIFLVKFLQFFFFKLHFSGLETDGLKSIFQQFPPEKMFSALTHMAAFNHLIPSSRGSSTLFCSLQALYTCSIYTEHPGKTPIYLKSILGAGRLEPHLPVNYLSIIAPLSKNP